VLVHNQTSEAGLHSRLLHVLPFGEVAPLDLPRLPYAVDPLLLHMLAPDRPKPTTVATQTAVCCVPAVPGITQQPGRCMTEIKLVNNIIINC
jgi:hypothetical protein